MEGARGQGLWVAVRTRPATAWEAKQPCLLQLDTRSLKYLGPECFSNVFSYDAIFEQQATQSQVFGSIQGIVLSVLQGFNASICAYGQTGSGKTHSLFGDIGSASDRGIVPRAMAAVCTGVSASTEDCKFSLTMSIVEIYCEKIRDLLNLGNENLQVQQDKVRGVSLANAYEASISSEDQLMSIMQHGLSNRAVAATAMNTGSSRSHCIVMLMLRKQFPDGRSQHSKLCLVDLAGSERSDKSITAGQTLDEGIQINKSLSALGNVVNALTDNRATHVPYRDSKLTRVLQDSLGGNAKTALIICCSPCMSNAGETLSSLRFGARAKGIINLVQTNACSSAGKDAADLLVKARRECDELRSQVKKLEGLQAELLASGSAEDAGKLAQLAAAKAEDAEGLGNTDRKCCQQAASAAQSRMVLLSFSISMVQMLASGAYVWWRGATCTQ
ncbi:hypothetical protein WJX74_000555 [Apatococcus lobatus]|uniref:Kinesin-like protein n=1 Tax=Apatococcus lobatus TaxID=904363 RepID=A0AAW1QD28_9CHLO